MAQIIPNTRAVPQVIETTPIVVNGTDITWPSAKIIPSVKVIHHGEYSFSVEETGGGNAQLKLKLQRDIGSGWEDVEGEVCCYTFSAGQDRRVELHVKIPYYDGISGFIPKYRMLAECPIGQVTMHTAEGIDGVPSGCWKQQHEFEGDPPVVIITEFIEQTVAATLQWKAVAYGNGLFVAVASSGTGNRVMTSPDGINWTSRTSAADEYWDSIAYGNGVFVATDRVNGNVMTSPDGENWTLTADLLAITDVTFGNGIFVASASYRMYRSVDGTSWLDNLTDPLIDWSAVTYGNGLFVAVATSGVGNRVVTSTDGINWTSRTSAADETWNTIAYGNGVFVAASGASTGINMMTSTDGINWTGREARPEPGSTVTDIFFTDGQFVALSSAGTANSAMASINGIDWSPVATPSGIYLRGGAGNNSKVVVVVGHTGAAIAQL